MAASNTTGVFLVTDVYDYLLNDMWVTSALLTVEYLLVAGGGSGGASGNGAGGGGGGAGGYRTETGYAITPGSPITVTVGAGGSGVSPGTFGTSSVFGSISTAGINCPPV